MTEEYCEDCKGIEIESWVDGQLVIETGSKLCQYHGMIDDLLSMLKDLFAMAKYYKPIPDNYEPIDEHDTENWIVGLLYKDVRAVIAAVEKIT